MVCLGRFMERIGVLPTTQFAYRKDLGTYEAKYIDKGEVDASPTQRKP